MMSSSGILAQNLSNRDSIAVIRRELQKTDDDKLRVDILSQLSTTFFNFSEIDSSVFYSLKAISLARNIGYNAGELLAILQLHIAARHSGNYIQAIRAAMTGLKKSEIYNDLAFKANFLGEIGITYREIRQYEKALSYLKKSYMLCDSLGNRDYAWYQLNNIGEVHLLQGNLDSAKYYCQIPYDSSSVRWIKYYSQINLAKILMKRKDCKNALLSFLDVLKVRESFPSHRFNNNLNLAVVYQCLNMPDSSILYAGKAIALAERLHMYTYSAEAHDFMASFFKNSDKEKSLFHTRAVASYKDSLVRFNEILAFNSFVEFDKEERQFEVDSARSTYQFKVRQYVLASGIGIMIVVTIILFSNNKRKQKTNKKLEWQKKQISEQRNKAEKTLSELKSTQSQLIQSEKMASLGELTAGIAHEIQNPLNFVNNFSEVNTELIKEIQDERRKTQDKRDEKLEDELLKDIVQNQEKINHHGKRASDIVKGMLQHSRSSSGVKEPTNINALADEYLRLAYHGLRAKDKSFNATMKTDFDDTIGNINIIPQDIGRVILNLITNAFYVVNERQKPLASSHELLANYEPTVSVSTKKEGNKVFISVKDNGNGIPLKILDKIFQPFFTTKPTGQGTGLGLSLSYDIVKAHGGEIKVNTKENEGTEFTISLPA